MQVSLDPAVREFDLMQERDELEQALAEMPSLQLPAPTKVLDTLNSVQFDTASNYLVFELLQIAKSIPLGEFIELGTWFDELETIQRTQIIKFYNARLYADHGLVLGWYDNYGQKGGYRFELALHPVASR